jgi:zinc protease
MKYSRVIWSVVFGLGCVKGQPIPVVEVSSIGAEETFSEPATATDTQPSAADVLSRYVDVTGGEEAYKAHQNYLAKGRLHIAAQGIEGTIELYLEAPSRKWMSMDIPGMGEVLRVFDGEQGWEINPMLGPRLLTEAELSTESHDGAFNAPLQWDSLYPERELLGAEEFETRACWKLRLVTAAGGERVAFFSQESGLLIGMDMTVPSDMGPMPVQVSIEDYREVDGVKMPFRSVQRVGPIEMVAELDSLEWNVEAPVDFEMPDNIKALLPTETPEP